MRKPLRTSGEFPTVSVCVGVGDVCVCVFDASYSNCFTLLERSCTVCTLTCARWSYLPCNVLRMKRRGGWCHQALRQAHIRHSSQGAHPSCVFTRVSYGLNGRERRRLCATLCKLVSCGALGRPWLVRLACTIDRQTYPSCVGIVHTSMHRLVEV